MKQPYIFAAGSSLLSALIAGAMGRIYGVHPTLLIVMIVVSALGGAWFGYRSGQQAE